MYYVYSLLVNVKKEPCLILYLYWNAFLNLEVISQSGVQYFKLDTELEVVK